MYAHHVPTEVRSKFKSASIQYKKIDTVVGHQEENLSYKKWVVRRWRCYFSGARCKWSSWYHCHPIVSCSMKIQIGLTFPVPTYPGCPGKEAVKRVS